MFMSAARLSNEYINECVKKCRFMLAFDKDDSHEDERAKSQLCHIATSVLKKRAYCNYLNRLVQLEMKKK